MTSYLIDINVWLALSWGRHPYSAAAHSWLGSLPRSQTSLLFCRITQLGLLRLLTHRMVMGESVLGAADAFGLFDRWKEDPRVRFASEDRGVDALFRNIAVGFGRHPATKSLMDAYLAAFAEGERATLVTFDKALSGISRRRDVAYVLLSTRPGA